MDELTDRFEEHRARLRGVAFRMLGSVHDADDAVQEAWLRLSRSDASAITNLGGWLTTVTGRICLDVLRARTSRREDQVDVVVAADERDPEAAALLAESVGVALYLVLDALSPAERVAFVLHDAFAVPFDDIARVLDRTPNATKQLASRARARVRAAAVPDTDLDGQRVVVDAFFEAAGGGDLDALVALLDEDAILTSAGRRVLGAAAVAGNAIMFALPTAVLQPVLVNGAAGVVVLVDGRPVSVMAFTVVGGRIARIDGFSPRSSLPAP